MQFDLPLPNPVPKEKVGKSRVSVQFMPGLDLQALPASLQLEAELVNAYTCRVTLYTSSQPAIFNYLKDRGGLPLLATITVPDGAPNPEIAPE